MRDQFIQSNPLLFSIAFKNVAIYHLTACRHGIYRRPLKMAIWVGTLLNCINQPEILSLVGLHDFDELKKINILKVILTYLVPFAVSLYSALSALTGLTKPEH